MAWNIVCTPLRYRVVGLARELQRAKARQQATKPPPSDQPLSYGEPPAFSPADLAQMEHELAEKARTIFPQPQIGTPKAYSLASQWASGGTQDLAFRLIAIELWSVPTCPPWTLGCCFPGRMHINSMQAFKPLVGDRQPKGSASGELPCVFGDVGVLYQNASRSASWRISSCQRLPQNSSEVWQSGRTDRPGIHCSADIRDCHPVLEG